VARLNEVRAGEEQLLAGGDVDTILSAYYEADVVLSALEAKSAKPSPPTTSTCSRRSIALAAANEVFAEAQVCEPFAR
jgi:hypothetical protein